MENQGNCSALDHVLEMLGQEKMNVIVSLVSLVSPPSWTDLTGFDEIVNTVKHKSKMAG